MKLENNWVWRALVMVNKIAMPFALAECFKSKHSTSAAHIAAPKTSKSHQEKLAVDLHLIGS